MVSRHAQPELLEGGKHVTLVGVGNIGSHAVDLLARLPELKRLTLVDADFYEPSNLVSQAIAPGDVGKTKVEVQARRVRRMHPGVNVRPLACWVQDVPYGIMRGDLIAACLDSRAARCRVNEIAWRLGVPLIDTGVDATGLLARVNVYRPGAGMPCAECAWNDDDYAAMEQTHGCMKGRLGPAATGAPASLGSVAAGLLALECGKLLSGDLADVAFGQQVMWDCRHYRSLATRYSVNARCRFDHQTWDVAPLAESVSMLTLGELFARVSGDDQLDTVTIGLAGHGFARRMVCPQCGVAVADCLYLNRGIPPARSRCRACREPMEVPGFHLFDSVCHGDLRRAHLRRSLSSIGFRGGDIIVVRAPSGIRHYEFRCPPARVEERSAVVARTAGEKESCR